MNPCLENLRAMLALHPVLGDGGMGTQLQQLGLKPGACGEWWNVTHPEQVQSVHLAYREAGAALITTNTFGGNSYVLAGHGAASRVTELNRAGARLAREIAGEQACVLGDIGPFGGMLEPLGDGLHDEVIVAFCEQAAALLDGGADAILIETMSDPVEAALAVAAAKSVGAEFIIATFTFQKAAGGYRTMMGTTVAQAMAAVIDAGADVVGANCGTAVSLDDYVRLTDELVRAAPGRPVVVQPNAGSPRLVGNRICYDESAREFAAAVPRLLTAGARIIGGCCGSTPEHIAAMAPYFSP